ncbi:MAG: hypothetical protein HZA54_08635, partial [Planctomycetes bacterium]|nr:hypothetical protein [Planctomycetota bacterium]
RLERSGAGWAVVRRERRPLPPPQSVCSAGVASAVGAAIRAPLTPRGSAAGGRRAAVAPQPPVGTGFGPARAYGREGQPGELWVTAVAAPPGADAPLTWQAWVDLERRGPP